MDFRYLVETKNEFNNFLCGILTPHLYHGIKGMLKYSENVYNQIELKKKKGSIINNPGIINIFKKTLEGITNLNNYEIEEEYLRIKNTSGCVEWFDNIVRAAFKSYVLFLTWDPKLENSKYSDNTIYETIIIKDFIHKCYIISCNYFRDNPELFISKSNKKEIFDILKMCIEMSIKKSLPFNQIINEYLNVDFTKINNNNSKEIENIKSMVFNIMDQKKYGSRPKINNLIVEETNENSFINLEDTETKQAQLENFINQEKIKEQNKLNNEQTQEVSDNETNKLSNVKTSSNINRLNTTDITTNTTNTTNNVSNETEQLSSKNTTGLSTTLLSRADLKSKEIDEIINNSNNSKTTDTSTDKTSIINIITSPPAIRIKKNDRIKDLLGLNKKINENKRNIKITRGKNNIISDKFDQAENFYDSMIKI